MKTEIKQQLKNLNIDWETDLNRMNFSDLRSYEFLRSSGFLNFDMKDKYQKVRLDTIDISNEYVYYKVEDIALYSQDDGTSDLINFIGKKNKIIPPLYETALEYCGETFETRQLYPIRRFDGHHRIFVSFFSGLKIIPIVVVERVKKFSFPIGKWNFERTDEIFIAKSKNGDHRIELDIRHAKIDKSMFSENILVVRLT